MLLCIDAYRAKNSDGTLTVSGTRLVFWSLTYFRFAVRKACKGAGAELPLLSADAGRTLAGIGTAFHTHTKADVKVSWKVYDNWKCFHWYSWSTCSLLISAR